ncbi:MAG: primosomal protein N' (replication factor Y) - superfamily II helicase [Proteobacteria bacterium]|nr:MAG: primosomal protein N' (replication factor Y) - superfamily II helicase [Pseudomonadota bacterium]
MKSNQSHFPCERCGSDLQYSPEHQSLECGHCGFTNEIPVTFEPIKEYDLRQALHDLERLQQSDKHEQVEVIKCPSCAAKFSLDEHVHAGDCPFCGTPVITDTERSRPIRPRSLLPFTISHDQAVSIFDRWMKTRWFAPSSLDSHAKRNDKLTGVYLPYWTYDSDTKTFYQGQRGTVYYVSQVVNVRVNGRNVQQVKQVPRIRWQPASGRVSRHFDDVLIGASKTLPRAIIDNLAPWDLNQLVPYSEAYLSGFRSEIYQITVDDGFLRAQQIMDYTIRQDIRRDIGGDQQRISHVSTQHDNTRYKHLLLPIWSAAFQYRNKTYRYVINGRTGKIHGERPYSIVKIASAAALAALIIGGGAYIVDQNGGFDDFGVDYYVPAYQYKN